jgi:putative spermidine/putrescine transport system ATP-binding protein
MNTHPPVACEHAQVEFRKVCKTYDGLSYAVKDLDLAIAKNEFMTLLGPSGSGKTTSLMMLAGFEAPTSGEILVAQKSMSLVAPHKRNIGVVFQNYALFPHMTVEENIAFPLSVRHMNKSEIKQKVDRALDLVRLAKYGARKPSELSGGQQQRVALARSLIFNPVLILMDEPLGALDKHLREQLQREIKRIHTELGVTVVYVTHDQSEALTMSDKIAVFNEGSIQQLATPAELYERPTNTFVASFIGENNLIECTLTEIAANTCVQVTACGQKIVATSIGNLLKGALSIVSVRPEKIALSPHPEQYDNIIETKVEQYIYNGDHVKVLTRMQSGSVIACKAPSLANLVRLKAGESLTLGWKSQDCRAFAKTA